MLCSFLQLTLNPTSGGLLILSLAGVGWCFQGAQSLQLWSDPLTFCDLKYKKIIIFQTQPTNQTQPTPAHMEQVLNPKPKPEPKPSQIYIFNPPKTQTKQNTKQKQQDLEVEKVTIGLNTRGFRFQFEY